MDINDRTLEIVKAAIVRTLGIEDRAATLNSSTPLFGSMPELDSFAVVELITSLEEQFGFEVDGIEITGELFETIGSVAEFVVRKTQRCNDTTLLAD
jgi:acyl carrier protein